MNITTETEAFPVLPSLVISPNLQALLEFDDRLRTTSETHGRSGTAPAGLTQDSQYPSWTQQEVPTAPLPPPRRKKNAVADVPMSPKTISDLQRVSSPTDSLPGIGEPGGLGEIIFARSEDELVDGLELELELKGTVNPYLNSPPSSPRYFYPLSDDDDDDDYERIGRPKSWSTRRHARQRSFSGDQPRGERKGVLPSKISVTRAAATRPLLLHSHKASFSSSHSHQTASSYEPSSSPEPPVSISSTIYSASSFRSLSIPSPVSSNPVQGSFIDLASPPMSPASDVWPYEQLAAKSTSRNHSPRSPNLSSRSSSPSQKPPIPTTPKPVFNRPHSIRKSSDGKPKVEDPPTTTLSFAERAELVKRTRKLTQLFGQTPGPEFALLSPGAASSLQQSHLASDVRRGHRVIASISNPLHPSDRGVWPPPEETVYLNIHGRRHSTPLSPTTVSTMWGSNEDDSVLDPDQRSSFYSNRHSKMRLQRKATSSSSIASPIPSPMSFIDLSDDESGAETMKGVIGRHCQAPFSKESLIDDAASLSTFTSTQIHEGERRKKREKLVKLHRFLGSRVPPDLALGFDLSSSPQLPPPASPEIEHDDTRKRFRVRKRRSSSFSGYTKPLTAREDRMKSELNIQEKALNVRRAAKMEKVFGVAPPQTLYHTRKSESPIPQSPAPPPMLSVEIDASPTLTPLEQLSFFTMQGFGYKGKKIRRPSTADSSQALISRSEASSSIEVYNSYRESLNSLSEIVDKDDKVSLELIHDILHAGNDDNDGSSRAAKNVDDDDHDSSEPDILCISAPDATSLNKRRRSLPLCPSVTSLRSECSIASIASITTPPPEISTFEQKRRRAAKLTNFFGVSHRDIMSDILESIESGVTEERGRGNLDQAQADDLLQKVWNLRTRT